MAAALAQMERPLSRYDKLRLNSQKYHSPLNRHVRNNSPVESLGERPTKHRIGSPIRKVTHEDLQELTGNKQGRRKCIYTSVKSSEQKRCNNQRNNPYQKVQVGEQYSETVVTVPAYYCTPLPDDEGYLPTPPRRTRKSSYYKSLKQTPAKSDNEQALNSADRKLNNNETNQVTTTTNNKQNDPKAFENYYTALRINEEKDESNHPTENVQQDDENVAVDATLETAGRKQSANEATSRFSLEKQSRGLKNKKTVCRNEAAKSIKEPPPTIIGGDQETAETIDIASTRRHRDTAFEHKRSETQYQQNAKVLYDTSVSTGMETSIEQRAGVLVPKESGASQEVADSIKLSEKQTDRTKSSATPERIVHDIVASNQQTIGNRDKQEKLQDIHGQTIDTSQRKLLPTRAVKQALVENASSRERISISPVQQLINKLEEGIKTTRLLELKVRRRFPKCSAIKSGHIHQISGGTCTPINSQIATMAKTLNLASHILPQQMETTVDSTASRNNLHTDENARKIFVKPSCTDRRLSTQTQETPSAQHVALLSSTVNDLTGQLNSSRRPNPTDVENSRVNSESFKAMEQQIAITHRNGAETRTDTQQQNTIDQQEGTRSRQNAPPDLNTAVCTVSQPCEGTRESYEKCNKAFKHPSPKGKPDSNHLDTLKGENISTNYNNNQQQVTTKHYAIVLPRSNIDTYGHEHSRRTVLESRQNRKIPTQRDHHNENTTKTNITLKTLNQYQSPSITNLATLTNVNKPKTTTKLSNDQHKQERNNKFNAEHIISTNLSETKTTNQITDRTTTKPTTGHHYMTALTKRRTATQTNEGKTIDQECVTKRNKETVETKEKRTEYNHKDLVTAKANIFPKTYINGGILTVGEEADTSYKHLIQISIHIEGSGNNNQSTSYDPVRVVYSILLALQYVDSTVRLVIWDNNGTENINNLPQVRSCNDLTKDNIADFMEDPQVHRKNNSFSGRVCILAACDLNTLKQNEKVRSWLKSEKVYLTKNNLSTVTTTPAGFITGWAPRNNRKIHERRLATILTNAPKFLVEYKRITDEEKGKCKITMIRCSQKDVAKLTNALKQLEPKCGFRFQPWDHYSSLKRQLTQTENAYITKNRSMVIDLSEGGDDVQIKQDLSEGEQHDKTRLKTGEHNSTVTKTQSKETKSMTYDNGGTTSIWSPASYNERKNKSQQIRDLNQKTNSITETLNRLESSFETRLRKHEANNSINPELKELKEKNSALTATVSRLERLIETIQSYATTTKNILRDTIDTMAEVDLAVTTNDLAIIKLNSSIIPTMRQEFEEKIESLRDNIDSGFADTISLFKQMPNWDDAPFAECQTKTTKQATTQSPTTPYPVNSFYCVEREDEMIDVTNRKRKTDYKKGRDKDKKPEAQKVLITKDIRNLEEGKSTWKGLRPHKGQHSILTRGDSKRDVTGGET
jgi:hypothetical protein